MPECDNANVCSPRLIFKVSQCFGARTKFCEVGYNNFPNFNQGLTPSIKDFPELGIPPLIRTLQPFLMVSVIERGSTVNLAVSSGRFAPLSKSISIMM